MRELFDTIERVLPEGGQWCSLQKAQTLAAIIVGLHPRRVCEIGVWMGGSAIPMALALRHNGHGHLVAIDPWSPAESMKGQSEPNRNWWEQAPHDGAFEVFCRRVNQLELGDFVTIQRTSSSDAPVPADGLDMLHVDGNHSEQAIRDVEKFAPHVRLGGIVVMDDIQWDGGAVATAVERLLRYGFEQRYELGTGAVFQRSNGCPSAS